MRGRGGAAAGSSFLLGLLLLLPPAANLSLEWRRGREGTPAGDAAETAPELEAAALRHRLWEKDRELELLRGLVAEHPRHRPLLCQAIPLGDVSPRRGALWLWGRGLEGATTRTAAVHRGALVGRVDRVWPDLGLAQVRTLRDSYFRIRFRHGDAWGFLFGTGKLDAEGRPLLEIRHHRVEAAFREGDRVFTDGDDGRYPGGIPIGTLVRSGNTSRGASPFMVRGEHRMDELTEAVLLLDRAAAEVRAMAAKDASAGERAP